MRLAAGEPPVEPSGPIRESTHWEHPIPHLLHLLVTDRMDIVEQVQHAPAVETGVSFAQIHFGIAYKMANSAAVQPSKSDDHSRSEQPYNQQQWNGHEDLTNVLGLAQERREPSSSHVADLTPNALCESLASTTLHQQAPGAAAELLTQSGGLLEDPRKVLLAVIMK